MLLCCCQKEAGLCHVWLQPNPVTPYCSKLEYSGTGEGDQKGSPGRVMISVFFSRLSRIRFPKVTWNLQICLTVKHLCTDPLSVGSSVFGLANHVKSVVFC